MLQPPPVWSPLKYILHFAMDWRVGEVATKIIFFTCEPERVMSLLFDIFDLAISPPLPNNGGAPCPCLGGPALLCPSFVWFWVASPHQ